MRKRTFVPELPEIRWKCRAPIGNGKLCERMDRYKCPFHGRIVARNEQGLPEDPTIRAKEEQEATKKQNIPAWQDPEMLADIRAATGVDLQVDKKKRKKKKTIASNLTDVNIEDNTPRKQLERKLLNRFVKLIFQLYSQKCQSNYLNFFDVGLL